MSIRKLSHVMLVFISAVRGEISNVSSGEKYSMVVNCFDNLRV